MFNMLRQKSESETAGFSHDSGNIPKQVKPATAWFRPGKILSFSGGLFLLAAVMLVSLGLGKYPVSPGEILSFFGQRLFSLSKFTEDQMGVLENVLLNIRLPRILAAALIGSALSVSGATYQAVFINPLMSPQILGVLFGASFGAAFGTVWLKSWYAVQIATFVGGLAAVGIAVIIALSWRGRTTIMLVLGGIISGALFSSLLELIKYTADPYNQLPAITYWLMGDLSQPDREMILKAAIPICLGIIVLISMGRQINVLSMGDEEARALGLNVNRIRLTVIFCATIISSMTVVIAGSIQWIGIIVPHLTRMITGPNNEKLIPAAAIFGAIYLIVVDDICRLLFSFELPIGIVTALIGIPCFAVVLRNARKGWS